MSKLKSSIVYLLGAMVMELRECPAYIAPLQA